MKIVNKQKLNQKLNDQKLIKWLVTGLNRTGWWRVS